VKLLVAIHQIGNSEPAEHFTVNEATALLNCHVTRREHLGNAPSVDRIGFVAGVITLNDDVEILLKFHDALEQVGKRDFEQRFVVIPTSG
jgi:hypothetical protein